MTPAVSKSTFGAITPYSDGANGDVLAWAIRNEHWGSIARQTRRHSGKHERPTQPLILCGHGVSLRIDKGTLLVRDGFTHWPQERREFRLFKGARDLPPRIVMLDGSGSLSFDVVNWLADQNMPLIRLDYQGDVVSVIGGSGFAMCPDKLRWQIETRDDPISRLEFSCDLIRRKLESSLRTLNAVVPAAAAGPAIFRLEASLERIVTGSITSIEELRLAEAVAAGAYFASWQGLPLHWRARKRHPVPDAWQAIGGRNTPSGLRSMSNRNAKHPMNAVLNYAYGMLSSQVHVELVAEGYDPRRGIMHHDRPEAGAYAFVFDMIEPRRAEIDAKALRFMLRTPFTGADFVINSSGVCRLAPQLAKRVCQEMAT